MTRIFILLRYAAAAIWHQLRSNEEGLYNTIYEAVENLGGVYVKFLQFLSLRADLFPDKAKLRFLTFYDQVPIEEIDVQAHLNHEQKTQFSHIETEPFASGTFGQVYKAELINGQEVVIKVKRDNLTSNLRTDFLLIRLIGFIFNLFYYQKFVDIGGLIREFEETTYKELDYEREVKNALFLYRQYQDHPTLVIPYTYQQLSNQEIIVQEYIGGIPVTELLRMRDKGQDINQWLADYYQTDMHFIMGRFSYDTMWQIFKLDQFYSDPHPGNIKILPNNKYAFVDFGIMEASPANKRDYFMVVKLLHQGAEHFDAMGLSKQFFSIACDYLYKCMGLYDKIMIEEDFSISQKVLDRFSEMIEEWREDYRVIETQQVENFTQVWLDLFTMGEQFDLRCRGVYLLGLRASALIKSVSEFMDPDFHAMKVIYQDLMNEINEDELVNYEVHKTADIGVEEAVETVSDWFESLAENDLGLYQDISRKLAI